MRKLRNGLTWLLFVSAIYLAVGLGSIALGQNYNVQLFYIVALSFPLWMPSFGRWLFMDVTWDLKMIDFFKGKKQRTQDNVVPFLRAVQPIPIPESSPEPARQYYRVGFTSDGSTTLTLIGNNGSSMTLTMNREACEHLIRMLEATYAN
jgi:hypothetical protein